MPKRADLALFAAVAALLLVAVPAGAQSEATASTEPTILQPGDVVRIAVWQRPDYNGEFLVSADSTLSHPLFQRVKVAGVPLSVAKARLDSLLKIYEKDPMVTLEPLLQVSVVGEVRQPNVYAMPRATTVGQAIARAGGPTENAQSSHVRLVRGGRELMINLNDPKSANALLAVRSGDQIVVHRRSNFVRDVLVPFASLTAAMVSVAVALRH